MKLEEEVDHYLAGLRDPDLDDPATIERVKGYFGHSTVCDSDKRVLDKLRHRKLSGEGVRQAASGEEPMKSGQEGVGLSDPFVSSKASSHLAASSPSDTVSYTAESVQHKGVHIIENLPLRQRKEHNLDAARPATQDKTQAMNISTSSIEDNAINEINTAADRVLELIRTIDIPAHALREIVRDFDAAGNHEKDYTQAKDAGKCHKCSLRRAELEREGRVSGKDMA